MRDAILFTDSIALKCDIKRLEKDLNCNIKVVPTYHIEKSQKSQDPELYLKKVLETELKEANVDFAIVSVGANDVTDLDLNENDFTTLINVACDQSKNIVHMVEHAAKRYDIDIFVVERPPRSDTENDDTRSILTQSANGLYMSLITPLERVHLIPLPTLSNFSGKVRRDCFESDGIHTNKKGSSNLSSDIIAGVKKVFKDLEKKQIFEKRELIQGRALAGVANKVVAVVVNNGMGNSISRISIEEMEETFRDITEVGGNKETNRGIMESSQEGEDGVRKTLYLTWLKNTS